MEYWCVDWDGVFIFYVFKLGCDIDKLDDIIDVYGVVGNKMDDFCIQVFLVVVGRWCKRCKIVLFC